MKTIHRIFTAFALTAAIIFSSFTAACSPGDLARNADRVAGALTRAQPLFQQLIDGGVIPQASGAAIIGRLTQGAAAGKQLADAFRNNNAQGAVEQTAALIRTVEQIIDQDAKLIRQGPQRTAVLAILAAADIALGFISDQLVKTDRSHHALTQNVKANESSKDTIRRYAKKKRLRCRSSVTGRFEKMEVCKANPDTTVIERW